jgi:glutaconate CoA-transferase, subunit A
VSKLTSLSDALDRHVGDGASVYVTGFTHLIDFAAAHELARRRVRDLTLIRMTPTSCTSTWSPPAARRASSSTLSAIPVSGPHHVIRRAIERGAIITPVNYGDNATIAPVER